jgi:hypothetical protein
LTSFQRRKSGVGVGGRCSLVMSETDIDGSFRTVRETDSRSQETGSPDKRESTQVVEQITGEGETA